MLFYSALGILIYIFLGYPLLILILSLLRRKPVLHAGPLRKVSVVLSVYDEEQVIEKKIQNFLSLDYPSDMIELLVGSDGSTDATTSIIQKYAAHENIKLVDFPYRQGKLQVIRDLVKRAEGEILVFTDAHAFFEHDVVRNLVKRFNDDSIGIVCGKLLMPAQEKATNPDNIYWKYETFIKEKESDLGGIIVPSGAIYAIRRNLWPSIDIKNILTDDLIVSLKILEQGYRAVFAADAIATERIPDDVNVEFRRRVRLVTGGLQSLRYSWKLLLPTRGFLSLSFLSHKILRWLSPVFFLTLFITNSYLLSEGVFYLFCFVSQVSVLVGALMGFLFKKYLAGRKTLLLPYYFMLINAAFLWGVVKFPLAKNDGLWERTYREIGESVK